MGETTGDGDPGRRDQGIGRGAGRHRGAAQRGHRGRPADARGVQPADGAGPPRLKTRIELDRLVADLPSTSVGDRGRRRRPTAPASWHVSPVGGLSVSGPWRMDRHVIAVSLIGGASLDLSQAQLAAPEVTLTKVSLLGGVWVQIPQGIQVAGVGLQPDRRHHDRRRPRARPQRPGRAYPSLLTARRSTHQPQRAVAAGTGVRPGPVGPPATQASQARSLRHHRDDFTELRVRHAVGEREGFAERDEFGVGGAGEAVGELVGERLGSRC